jgi:hypothetical protein
MPSPCLYFEHVSKNESNHSSNDSFQQTGFCRLKKTTAALITIVMKKPHRLSKFKFIKIIP